MSSVEVTSVVETSQQLRVAIFSDSVKQRQNLKLLLKARDVNVVDVEPLSAVTIRRIDTDNTDVLLVDMDDNVEHELDFLDELLESPVPILFNDATSTRMKAAQRNSDWARMLVTKLAQVAGFTGSDYGQKTREQTSVVIEEIIDDAPLGDKSETPDSVSYMVEAEYLEIIEQQAIERVQDEISHEIDEQKQTIDEQPAHTAGIAARNVWVIGASIGGPQSVKRFLANIQTTLPVAFILAQHIGGNFVSLLAKQLDKITRMQVIAAKEGHLLKHNEVVVAPTSQRITLDKQGYIRLKPMECESIYTPSIDTVMTDISMRYGTRTSAIMFSGMGSDGVRGSQLIASRGGRVWAQDAESCVISSMPDSTRRTGIVEFSDSPEGLAAHLVEYFETNTK